MAKTTAWLTTLIGVLLVLPLLGIDQLGTVTSGISAWLIGLSFLIIGVTKLVRNYSKKR